MATNQTADISATVAGHLPYLRRYARALTGNQASGDRYAIATLEAVLADPSALLAAGDAKVGLFAMFHGVWASTGAPVAEADTPLSAAAQAHLARLTPNTREVLLLHSIEGFGLEAIGDIIGADANEAAELLAMAQRDMASSMIGRVLVIEDEAIIAMDISAIVEGMGHHVTGIARTKAEAVARARADRPDLVLADIQLADNSSGIDAVREIHALFPGIPAVFITAFPERLLTGTGRNEPAFMITKPYSEDQVRSAVSQAMFFASTETLMA